MRYLMCGEYGEKLGRPHYHYVLFGYDFEDKYYWKTSLSGTKLYRSKLLDKLWPFGHAWIGDVDYATCAYIAQYVTKKITGEPAVDHYRRTDEAGNDYWLVPEFGYMSRNPGLGKEWFMQHHNDLAALDQVILAGNRSKLPRYYNNLWEKLNPNYYTIIKTLRKQRAAANAEDNTARRLADKEAVATAKLKLKKRNLETT